MKKDMLRVAIVFIILAIILAVFGGPFTFNGDGFPVNMNWIQVFSFTFVIISGQFALAARFGYEPSVGEGGDEKSETSEEELAGKFE